MWTCYDYDTETGADVAYILLADVHPGESAIKLVQAQVRPEQEVSSSIDKAVRSLILEFDDEDRLIAIGEVVNVLREGGPVEVRPKVVLAG